MKSRIAVMGFAVACMLLATVLFSADIDLRLAAGEHIADAVVFDDGLAVVAIASVRPRSTQLVEISGGTLFHTQQFPGLTATELRWAGTGEDQRPRILLGGGIERPTGPEYVYRLIEITADGGFLEVWNSESLRDPLDEDDQFELAQDGHGQTWAVLRDTPKKLIIDYGTFGSQRSRRAIADAPGEGGILRIIDVTNRRPLILVLRGNTIFSLDASKSRPSFHKLALKNVKDITIDYRTQMVFFKLGEVWSAFSPKQLLAESVGDPLAVSRELPPGATRPRLSGKVFDGTAPPAADGLHWWRVSPSGSAIIGLRRGTSNTIYVQANISQQ